MGNYESSLYSNEDEDFLHTLAVQSWIAYAFGMLFILLRMYARVGRLGVKGLQADDYLMVLAAVLYTTLIVCLNIYPKSIDIKLGSLIIASEQAMLNLIYVIKACMLIIYNRLTLGLQVRKMLTYLTAYVVVGWCASQIAFFTTCRPFKGYWDATIENSQCTTLEHYAIVQACFNISSDIMMLAIPLPLLIKLNVPLKQKLAPLLVFSMGIFVILAALLTKIYNLTDLYNPSFMLWYVRESSVAVYVSNLPLIWPKLQEWFPTLKAITPLGRVNASQTPNLDNGASIQKLITEKLDRRMSRAISETPMTTVINGRGEADMYEQVSELDTVTKHEISEHFHPTDSYHELPTSE